MNEYSYEKINIGHPWDCKGQRYSLKYSIDSLYSPIENLGSFPRGYIPEGNRNYN